ncbi:MAG: hypothetical protein IJU65_00530 [Desulfovibrio sp.]|nr:hypothetical protein [Desulfovibrio sp.]
MQPLFDPLRALRSLGLRVSLDADTHELRTEWTHNPSYYDRRKADMWLKRFDSLLKLQLDVPENTLPRTVQQLMASGKVKVVEGKFIRV